MFRIRIASKTALRRDEPAGGDAQADDADTGCQIPFRRDKLGGDEREPITTAGVKGYGKCRPRTNLVSRQVDVMAEVTREIPRQLRK